MRVPGVTPEFPHLLEDGLQGCVVAPLGDRHARTLQAVAERVAAKYQLGMSPYFGETEHSMFDVPVAQKQSAFRAYVDSLKPGPLHLAVIHVAQSTPEIRALVDMNNATQNTATGAPLMAQHRQAELDMLLQFARGPQSKKVALVNYATVIARLGRASMKRPAAQ